MTGPMVIAATRKMVDAARRRLLGAAFDAAAAQSTAIETAAPGFTAALAGLPELRPFLAFAPELRAPVLDALADAFALVPRVTWERLGVAHLFNEARFVEAARQWALGAAQGDLEAAGAVIDGGTVYWPAPYELPAMPYELRKVAKARG